MNDKICPKCKKVYLTTRSIKHVKTKQIVGTEYIHKFDHFGIIPTLISCYLMKKEII